MPSGPEPQKAKPSLTLIPGRPSEQEILDLYRRLTGREPSAEEVEGLRRQGAKGPHKEPAP